MEKIINTKFKYKIKLSLAIIIIFILIQNLIINILNNNDIILDIFLLLLSIYFLLISINNYLEKIYITEDRILIKNLFKATEIYKKILKKTTVIRKIALPHKIIFEIEGQKNMMIKLKKYDDIEPLLNFIKEEV
jgi:hypothetical protein